MLFIVAHCQTPKYNWTRDRQSVLWPGEACPLIISQQFKQRKDLDLISNNKLTFFFSFSLELEPKEMLLQVKQVVIRVKHLNKCIREIAKMDKSIIR